MAESSIPVDLSNPGQVFACLGFLEAADVLCGNAEGGFDWNDEADVKFRLSANGGEDPFETVLKFLSHTKTKAVAVAPYDWRPKKEPTKDSKRQTLERELSDQKKSDMFPSASPETISAMPVELIGSNRCIRVEHWADGSSRNEFKLYSGNRSALHITRAMLKDIAQLWTEQHEQLIRRPFDAIIPMRGSFNFDPRGAWTPIDAGYSPNMQDHKVGASPVVEFLAALGLENARPDEFETRKVRYAAWGVVLPPMLARVALVDRIAAVPMRRYCFELDMSGKNKIVTFAKQENTYD